MHFSQNFNEQRPRRSPHMCQLWDKAALRGFEHVVLGRTCFEVVGKWCNNPQPEEIDAGAQLVSLQVSDQWRSLLHCSPVQSCTLHYFASPRPCLMALHEAASSTLAAQEAFFCLQNYHLQDCACRKWRRPWLKSGKSFWQQSITHLP